MKEQEEYRATKRFLMEEDNLLGKTERNGLRYYRKYIPNIVDQRIRLYYTNIKPINTDTTKLIANLCIIHGFAHYSAEFYELASFLAKNGINCHLIDLRGHGYSGNHRFDFAIEEFHSDVITLIKTAESDGVDLPLFVLGHSMGGGLISSLFINNQYLSVNGVILSAPLLGFPQNVPIDKFKHYALNSFGNELKDFIINAYINPTVLTKDDRETIRIIHDKKMLPLACTRSLRSMLKNCERILENSRYFNLPLLIIHGTKDRICRLDDSKYFVDNVRSKVKELYTIEEGYHEIFNDIEREEYFNKILSWITQNKNKGTTHKRKDFPNLAFPIDITIGPPRPIYHKVKISILFKLIVLILYVLVGYK